MEPRGDLSSKVWWYHSHIDEPNEVNRGLLGPIGHYRAADVEADENGAGALRSLANAQAGR